MTAPVVIIGSGINGLVAAADLAQRGRKVIVLERAARPGGAVRTEELTLPGFKHDVAAMNLSTFAGSGFMKRHGAEMGRHGLELAQSARPFAQALEPGDHLGISTDLDETLSTFHSEADKDTWRKLLAGFSKRGGVLGRLLATPIALFPLLGTGAFALRRLGIRGTIDLARLFISSPRAWLDENFEDPRLRSALSSWGMHLDFAPDIAGGAIFPYLEGIGGQAFGMVLPKGGAGQTTEALVRMIEAHGGEVRCNADVTRITQSGGRVTGVEIGGETMAAETVLACLAPKHLLRLLGRTDTPAFDRAMQKFRHGPGTMMIHLALDGPMPWLAKALQGFAYVHIARSVDTAAATYAEAMAGLLPAEPVLVIGQPTVVDPTRAPDGKHVLWVQVRALPATIAGDAKNEIESRDWQVAKLAMAERVFDLIEKQAPGFRDLVLASHVVSPLDLEAGNPNLVGGDQVCGSHHLSQNFIFRPAAGYADGKTPVKGLHLIGAATWPGAGTAAGSGFAKAQKV